MTATMQPTQETIVQPISFPAYVGPYIQQACLPKLIDGWDKWSATQPVERLADPMLYADSIQEALLSNAIELDRGLMTHADYAAEVGQSAPERRIEGLFAALRGYDWQARGCVAYKAAIDRVNDTGDLPDSLGQALRAFELEPAFKQAIAQEVVKEYAGSIAHPSNDLTSRTQRHDAFESLLGILDATKTPIVPDIEIATQVRRITDKFDRNDRVTDADISKLRKIQARQAEATDESREVMLDRLGSALEQRWRTLRKLPNRTEQASQAEAALFGLGFRQEQVVQSAPAPKAPIYVSDAATKIDLPKITAPSESKVSLGRILKTGALLGLGGIGFEMLSSAAAVAEPVQPPVAGQYRHDQAGTSAINGSKVTITKAKSVASPVTNIDSGVELLPLAPTSEIGQHDAALPNAQTNVQPQASYAEDTVITAPETTTFETQLVPMGDLPAISNTASTPNTDSQSTQQTNADGTTQPTTLASFETTTAGSTLTVPDQVTATAATTTKETAAPPLLVVDQAPASSGVSTETTPPAATITVPEAATAVAQPGSTTAEITDPATAAHMKNTDEYNKLLKSDSVSLEDLVAAGDKMVNSQTIPMVAANTPQSTQAVINKAAGLYAAIEGPNSGLTDDQKQTAKEHIVNAILISRYPALLSDSNFANGLLPSKAAPELGIYTQAIATNYVSPEDGATANSEGVQQPTMMAITQQLSYADASMYSADGRLAQLQQTNPDAYKQSVNATNTFNAQQRAAQLAVTARANAAKQQAAHDRPAPAENAPAPAHQEGIPPGAEVTLTPHALDIATAKAMSKESGVVGRQGKFLLFMFQEGANSKAAIGAAGSMMIESQINPTRVQDGMGSDSIHMPASVRGGKGGYGMEQATFPTRQQAILDKAAAKHLPEGTMEVQLAVIHDELKGYPGMIDDMNSGSIEHATHIWTFRFERPQQGHEHEDWREAAARKVAATFNKHRTIIAAAHTVHKVQHQAAPSSLQATGTLLHTTVEAFSWDSPHGANNGKKAYLHAESKLAAKNKPGMSEKKHYYISEGGADCGGFTGTTLRYTGIDPNVPSMGTYNQLPYYLANPDKYVQVKNEGKHTKLQDGVMYVFIVNKGKGAGGMGHTWFQYGSDIFGKHAYGASYGDEMPFQQSASGYLNGNKDSFDDGRGAYHIFAIKGAA